jgi:hypothetical protein
LYVIRRVGGEGYKAPNVDSSGNPLPDEKRNYMGHSDMKTNISYKSEMVKQDLNPSWNAHVLDIFW